MKYILFFILFCLFSCQKNEQKTIKHYTSLDSISTQSEIQNYIRKKDTVYKNFEVKQIHSFDTEHQVYKDFIALANKHNITKAFGKADFDQNGYIDLLAIGDSKNCIGVIDSIHSYSCSYDPIVIMNFPNNKSKTINLNNSHSIVAPKIYTNNGVDFLKVYKTKYHGVMAPYYDFNKKSDLIKKLTYKFDGFIEYNANPPKHTIEKIEYKTSMCFGHCPLFYLSFEKNKDFLFKAEHFNFGTDEEIDNQRLNDKPEGYFKLANNKIIFENLCSILNYVNFNDLQDYYTVTWTDDQTSYLIITYDNGKQKIIQDYGMQGSYGLKLLYDKFFDYRFSLSWEMSKPFKSFDEIEYKISKSKKKFSE